MTDSTTAAPREAPPPAEASPSGALGLLRNRDFRHLYLAVAVSELGDSFHYIALMWFALTAGGPIGVAAVRLADSVPSLLFGLWGGLAADRWPPKRILIGADLVRGVVLVPITVAGLAGRLPLWGLVAAAFVLESATSYFAPAYGVLLPSLVDRQKVQAANGLVRATANALSIGGWAVAALLLAVMPMSGFFALNAASFFASALLIRGIRFRGTLPELGGPPPRISEGFAALRELPSLRLAVVAVGISGTLSAGAWIGGVPELVRTDLHRGPASFSIVMVGYAVGAVAAGLLLARWPIQRKARASILVCAIGLPAYAVLGLAGSLFWVVLGGFLAGLSGSADLILLSSAAQELVPKPFLGRVMGLISLVHRGAHAAGLLLVSPLFAIFKASQVFLATALALGLVGTLSLWVTSSDRPRSVGPRNTDRPPPAR